MFSSRHPSRQQDPRNPTPDDPPKPSDRYALTDCIRLDLLDVTGKPVTVIMSRKSALHLADRLFAQLCVEVPEGGGK